MLNRRKVVLRDINIPEENREHHLTVQFNSAQDLVLSGWDISDAAEIFLGNEENEYTKIIKQKDLIYLRKVLGINEKEDLLDFLVKNYSAQKSFEFESLLKTENVPFELEIW